MTKIALSVLALGIALASPAFAESPKHKALVTHTNNLRGVSAHASGVGGGASEPTYMAIQTRSWGNGD